MNFFAGVKKATHYIAVGFAAVAVFSQSEAGQALIKQYPKLSAITVLIGAIGALYRNPKP